MTGTEHGHRRAPRARVSGNLTEGEALASDAAVVAFVAFLVLTFALPGFLAKLLCGVAAVFAVLIIVAVRAGS